MAQLYRPSLSLRSALRLAVRTVIPRFSVPASLPGSYSPWQRELCPDAVVGGRVYSQPVVVLQARLQVLSNLAGYASCIFCCGDKRLYLSWRDS